MDVHKETIAVASGAQDHGAAATFLGPLGTRPCDIDPRVRNMPSQATHLVFVDEAGPGGSGRSRARTNQGNAGRGVAPSRSPQTAGDRVNTDRTDAVPVARRARSGELTPV